jgi:hypothetical protein
MKQEDPSSTRAGEFGSSQDERLRTSTGEVSKNKMERRNDQKSTHSNGSSLSEKSYEVKPQLSS